MPSIAPSANVATPSLDGSTSVTEHPPFRHGPAGASVDGRSRAPEAARPQGGRAPAVGCTSTEAPGLNPAAAGGLVICAENVRQSVDDGIAAGELRAIDALGLRFPSPEMVTAAAALFEPEAPWPVVLGVAASNRNRDVFASQSVPVSCGSGGPIPFGPN